MFTDMTSHSQTPNVRQTAKQTAQLNTLRSPQTGENQGGTDRAPHTPGFLKCPHQPSQELNKGVRLWADRFVPCWHPYFCCFCFEHFVFKCCSFSYLKGPLSYGDLNLCCAPQHQPFSSARSHGCFEPTTLSEGLGWEKLTGGHRI